MISNYYGKKQKKDKDKPTWNGIIFDSDKEMKRFQELSEMYARGEIHHLERQVRMDAVINGKKVFYIVLDHKYTVAGKIVYEDVKPTYKKRSKVKKIESIVPLTTPDWNIKKKVIEALYDITIQIF